MYKWIILMSGLFASLTACAKVKLSPLFPIIWYFSKRLKYLFGEKHLQKCEL